MKRQNYNLIYYAALASLTLMLYSCTYLLLPYRQDFKAHSVSLYDKVSGGIDSLININGFYTLKGVSRMRNWMVKPSFVFYADGTMSTVKWKDDLPVFSNIPNINIKEHSGKIKKNIFSFREYDLRGGLYHISNDTVVCEFVEPDFLYGTSKVQYVFKVKDRNTLRLIRKELMRRRGPEIYTTDYHDEFCWTFYPAIEKPDSTDTYDKHLRYRWDNVENWKKYKRSLKGRH